MIAALTRKIQRKKPLVAVVLSERAAQWAMARRAGEHLEVTSEPDILLNGEAAERNATETEAELLQKIRAKLGPQPVRLLTALDSREVVCRVLKLPALDPHEVAKMVEFQIEKLAPLPLDDVVWDYEVIETGENFTKVMVAIAAKDAVNAKLEQFESANLPAEVVSVDILPIFSRLRQAKLLPTGDELHALVVFRGAEAKILVFQRGSPLLVRSVALDGSAASESGCASLRDELQHTFLAVQLDVPDTPIGKILLLPLFEDDANAAESARLRLGFDAQIVRDPEDSLAAASLCWRGLEEKTHGINLLPAQWRQRRREKQLRRMAVRGGIALGAAYVLAVAVFFIFVGVRKAQISRLDRKIEALTPAYTEARQLQDVVHEISRQLDRTYSALEMLREVSVAMPQGMTLNAFVFKRDQNLTLRGTAQSAANVYEFTDRLKNSPLFSAVEPRNVRTEEARAGGLTRFEIVCTVKTAVRSGRTGTRGT
jgi:Tfp pilus assembly protein PilN